MGSFQFTGNKISTWKSTGIFNYSSDSNMNAVGDSGGGLSDIKNDGRMYVYLSGNHFQKISVKWSVLAHLKSQPNGQNFQAQI